MLSILSMFSMPIYQSEYEKFHEALRVRHPDWGRGQREGLDRLWNRKTDTTELESYGKANEKKKAYPYDVNF